MPGVCVLFLEHVSLNMLRTKAPTIAYRGSAISAWLLPKVNDWTRVLASSVYSGGCGAGDSVVSEGVL